MEDPRISAWQGRQDSELASVITSLEPDQLSAAKAEHHWPRRRLTTIEIVFFWALRTYVVFMLGVVIYQIWETTR
jgi:hypothetical protein